MDSNLLAVSDDLVVSLDYSLSLEEGAVIDTTDGDEPLEYLHGRGQIIPGLEKALYGMVVGDEKQVTVKPADGYGEVDTEDNVFLPLESFPPDVALEIGESIYVRDSESDEEYQAFIVEIGEEEVRLDFNHPLAGQTLYFDVKIEGLRSASSEEMAHGHVHTHGHAH
jgi:FKBP-type peptidyl-prolyl cis-trans isomerase SlyD